MLFTIGLVFMAMPIANYFLGDQPQQVHLPPFLQGRFEWAGVGIGVYRLFIILICGAIAAALQTFLVGTRFGAQLRAAVDDARVASGLGIDVDRSFAITFAIGCGLAGLGGALAADVVGGIDPSFPVKFMVSFLIVVTVGGSRGILGALLRRAAARHPRCRRQILRALDRRLHHLCRDGRHAAGAPAGSVRAGRRAMSGDAAGQCAALPHICARAPGAGRDRVLDRARWP